MERCARCGGRGHALWTKGEQTLPLCLTHDNAHRLALIAQGWAVRLFAKA